jgi:arginine/lysine/ornithine decarboxylase
MKKLKAPLYEALIRFRRNDPVSFHVPGHKNGAVWGDVVNNTFRELLSIDVTELDGLDDLHSPTGVIAEAQSLTAKFYKVKSSYFLVNGTTVGNLAMILATFNPGDRVIVQRNSHKSIMNALFLAKVKPVFVAPIYDSDIEGYSGVSFANIKKAIEKYPDCKGIVITNPNYYGLSVKLTSMIEYAHKYKISVLVDEAHGAHFSLGNPFPTSAILQGADIVVHSAHKTLPAMTMGSYLHFNSKLINEDKIKFFLSALQSSSPSYPIMASLDLARYYLEELSEVGYQNIISNHLEFISQLHEIPQLKIVESKMKESVTDPLKVIIQAKSKTSGYDLKKILEIVDIHPELADSRNVLLVLPLAELKNREIIIKKIRMAVSNLPIGEVGKEKLTVTYDPISEVNLTYEEMERYPKRIVNLKESIGRIVADDIIPYPPGIPLLMRGEIIKQSHINIITNLIKQGATFQGNEYTIQNKLTVFQL